MKTRLLVMLLWALLALFLLGLVHLLFAAVSGLMKHDADSKCVSQWYADDTALLANSNLAMLDCIKAMQDRSDEMWKSNASIPAPPAEISLCQKADELLKQSKDHSSHRPQCVLNFEKENVK